MDVFQQGLGRQNFFRKSYTQNTRSTALTWDLGKI